MSVRVKIAPRACKHFILVFVVLVLVFIPALKAYAEEPLTQLVPVYASSLNDSNHADEVRDELRPYWTYNGKTIILPTSDGKYLDVSRSVSATYPKLKAAFDALDESEQFDGLRHFNHSIVHPEFNIPSNKDVLALGGASIVEHPSTHTFEISTGYLSLYMSSFSVQPGDNVFMILRAKAYVKNPSDHVGAYWMPNAISAVTSNKDEGYTAMKLTPLSSLVGNLAYRIDDQAIDAKPFDNYETELTFWDKWGSNGPDSFEDHVIWIKVPRPENSETFKNYGVAMRQGTVNTTKAFIDNPDGSSTQGAGASIVSWCFWDTNQWVVNNMEKTGADTVVPIPNSPAIDSVERPDSFLFTPEFNMANYLYNYKEILKDGTEDLVKSFTPVGSVSNLRFAMTKSEYTNYRTKALPGYIFVSTTIPEEQKRIFITEAVNEETGERVDVVFERVYRQVPGALAVQAQNSVNKAAIAAVAFELWSSDHSKQISDVVIKTAADGTYKLYHKDESALTPEEITELAYPNSDGIITTDDGVLIKPGDYSLKLVSLPDNYVMPEDPFFAATVVASTDQKIALTTATVDILPKHTVTFKTNEGTLVDPQVIAHGDVVDLDKATTTREGYTLGGWFVDEALTQPYQGEAVENDMVLYAKWEATSTSPDDTKSEMLVKEKKKLELPKTSDLQPLGTLSVMVFVAGAALIVALKLRSTDR